MDIDDRANRASSSSSSSSSSSATTTKRIHSSGETCTAQQTSPPQAILTPETIVVKHDTDYGTYREPSSTTSPFRGSSRAERDHAGENGKRYKKAPVCSTQTWLPFAASDERWCGGQRSDAASNGSWSDCDEGAGFGHEFHVSGGVGKWWRCGEDDQPIRSAGRPGGRIASTITTTNIDSAPIETFSFEDSRSPGPFKVLSACGAVGDAYECGSVGGMPTNTATYGRTAGEDICFGCGGYKSAGAGTVRRLCRIAGERVGCNSADGGTSGETAYAPRSPRDLLLYGTPAKGGVADEARVSGGTAPTGLSLFTCCCEEPRTGASECIGIDEASDDACVGDTECDNGGRGRLRTVDGVADNCVRARRASDATTRRNSALFTDETKSRCAAERRRGFDILLEAPCSADPQEPGSCVWWRGTGRHRSADVGVAPREWSVDDLCGHTGVADRRDRRIETRIGLVTTTDEATRYSRAAHQCTCELPYGERLRCVDFRAYDVDTEKRRFVGRRSTLDAPFVKQCPDLSTSDRDALREFRLRQPIHRQQFGTYGERDRWRTAVDRETCGLFYYYSGYCPVHDSYVGHRCLFSPDSNDRPDRPCGAAYGNGTACFERSWRGGMGGFASGSSSSSSGSDIYDDGEDDVAYYIATGQRRRKRRKDAVCGLGGREEDYELLRTHEYSFVATRASSGSGRPSWLYILPEFGDQPCAVLSTAPAPSIAALDRVERLFRRTFALCRLVERGSEATALDWVMSDGMRYLVGVDWNSPSITGEAVRRDGRETDGGWIPMDFRPYGADVLCKYDLRFAEKALAREGEGDVVERRRCLEHDRYYLYWRPTTVADTIFDGVPCGDGSCSSGAQLAWRRVPPVVGRSPITIHVATTRAHAPADATDVDEFGDRQVLFGSVLRAFFEHQLSDRQSLSQPCPATRPDFPWSHNTESGTYLVDGQRSVCQNPARDTVTLTFERCRRYGQLSDDGVLCVPCSQIRRERVKPCWSFISQTHPVVRLGRSCRSADVCNCAPVRPIPEDVVRALLTGSGLQRLSAHIVHGTTDDNPIVLSSDDDDSDSTRSFGSITPLSGISSLSSSLSSLKSNSSNISSISSSSSSSSSGFDFVRFDRRATGGVAHAIDKLRRLNGHTDTRSGDERSVGSIFSPDRVPIPYSPNISPGYAEARIWKPFAEGGDRYKTLCSVDVAAGRSIDAAPGKPRTTPHADLIQFDGPFDESDTDDDDGDGDDYVNTAAGRGGKESAIVYSAVWGGAGNDGGCAELSDIDDITAKRLLRSDDDDDDVRSTSPPQSPSTHTPPIKTTTTTTTTTTTRRTEPLPRDSADRGRLSAHSSTSVESLSSASSSSTAATSDIDAEHDGDDVECCGNSSSDAASACAPTVTKTTAIVLVNGKAGGSYNDAIAHAKRAFNSARKIFRSSESGGVAESWRRGGLASKTAMDGKYDARSTKFETNASRQKSRMGRRGPNADRDSDEYKAWRTRKNRRNHKREKKRKAERRTTSESVSGDATRRCDGPPVGYARTVIAEETSCADGDTPMSTSVVGVGTSDCAGQRQNGDTNDATVRTRRKRRRGKSRNNGPASIVLSQHAAAAAAAGDDKHHTSADPIPKRSAEDGPPEKKQRSSLDNETWKVGPQFVQPVPSIKLVRVRAGAKNHVDQSETPGANDAQRTPQRPQPDVCSQVANTCGRESRSSSADLARTRTNNAQARTQRPPQPQRRQQSRDPRLRNRAIPVALPFNLASSLRARAKQPRMNLGIAMPPSTRIPSLLSLTFGKDTPLPEFYRKARPSYA